MAGAPTLLCHMCDQPNGQEFLAPNSLSPTPGQQNLSLLTPTGVSVATTSAVTTTATAKTIALAKNTQHHSPKGCTG